MASFSEETTNALENVIETKVQERCQGLIAENTRLFVEKQELGNRIQNLETENMELRARAERAESRVEEVKEASKAKENQIYSLTKTLDGARDLMRVLDDEFGDLERNVRDIESSIRELQRELEEDD